MKIEEFKIELDKDVFYAGEKVTGRLLVRSNDPHLDKNLNAFALFYDKMEIAWTEKALVATPFKLAAHSFVNHKKPFEVNLEAFFDRRSALVSVPASDSMYTFAYPFEFQLPSRLQGTLNFSNATCNYFIKAYLTDDEAVSQHYQKNVNTFSEFFKSLTHKFCKQQIVIFNRPIIPNELAAQKHTHEADSPNLHVTVTLPKHIFNRGEAMTMQIDVANKDTSKEKLGMHKIAIKVHQIVMLTSEQPYETRLFENLIAHKSRKSLHENFGNRIVIDESIDIPKDIPSTSTRKADPKQEEYLDPKSGERLSRTAQQSMYPIRVNYKLSLGFWRNFLNEDLEMKIPLLIEPEP